jgi:hypothetical protein
MALRTPCRSPQVCLAKGLGLWLVSDHAEHRASFPFASGDGANRSALNVSEPAEGDGAVVLPLGVYHRERGGRGSREDPGRK